MPEDEGGAYYGSREGRGGGRGGRRRSGSKRGGISLPEIASVDGYQGREKEVRKPRPPGYRCPEVFRDLGGVCM